MHRLSPRRAFTLIELIVVVMILGILATIAVPKFLKTSARARDNATRSSLAVVRNAIEIYTADHNGELPGRQGDLPGDLSEYIRGGFPIALPKGSNAVSYYSVDEAALTPDTSTSGWRYSTVTGEFILNSDDPLGSDEQLTYNQL